MAGKRNKNGRYIPKNTIINTPNPKPASSSKFTFSKIIIYIIGSLFLYFTCPLLVELIKTRYEHSLSAEKIAEADLTLKEYRFERDTPKYRVYAVNFTINNTGNQDFTLIQAIPYDPEDKSSTLNFLQNNSCESYKNTTIEGGKLKDFTMHVFVPKEFIEIAKIREKYVLEYYSLADSSNGEKLKSKYSYSKFEIVAKVLIRGADKKYRGAVSAPFPMPYSKGEEYSGEGENNQLKAPTSVEFEERNEYFYKCPIKNITE